MTEETTEALTYEQRFLEADAWNEAERKKAGLITQTVYEGIIYSIVCEPPVRVVFPDASKDRMNPGLWTVYAQDHSITDPDKAYLWDHPCTSELEAALSISQDIQKRVLEALLPQQFNNPED